MNPINLKSLPEYLKKLKKENKFDENLVVDMGKISNSPKINPFVLFLILFFASFGLIPFISFSRDVTIVITANDLSQEEVSDIIQKNGAGIISIENNGIYSYKIKLKKLSNLKEFIDKLKNNKSFKNIEVK
jgi:hypothetical protein